MDKTLLKAVMAEFLGTYVLLFAGCGAIVVDAMTGALGHVGVALTFGFVIVVLIYTFGHLSGAHFNPAVTLSFVFTKEFEVKALVPYIVAQVLGAIVAILTLWVLVLPESLSMKELNYLGATLPRGVWWQSFLFEIVLTFILMIVIYGAAVHGKAIKSFAGLAIGFTVGLEALFAGPITGASMNPARSLAPALVSGNVEMVWIYITAPVIGALLAGVWFVLFMRCSDPSECKTS
jgi:aquaporin Z